MIAISALRVNAAVVLLLGTAVCASPRSTPSPLEAARPSVVQLRLGARGHGSGVFVAPRLILTAAHCLVGLQGELAPQPASIEIAGVGYPLELVEMGSFKPGEGKVDDWALLRLPAAASSGVPAVLASPAELARLERGVTDALDDRQIALGAISHPSFALRAHPRSPFDGKNVFISMGFLKSDRAYRETALLGAESGIIYDDAAPAPPPHFAGDVDQAFARSKSGVARAYAIYHSAGRPLLYHSADYAPGSSGGGVFLADSGHLIGIIPWGATVVSRNAGYAGFGQAYRIDVICAQSKVMGALAGCAALKRGERAGP